jgi:hypothetical protein
MAKPPTSEPLQVIEDAETGNRFVVYTNKDGLSLELKFDGESPWFTQADLAKMFGVTVPTINKHLQTLATDGELDISTMSDFLIVRNEGERQVQRPITHYGLDVGFYVGYRVNSAEGKLFRRWATSMLVQLAIKGFVVDQRRLKSGGNADRVRELREIIRDLRSEEANLYAELRDICAMCQDYKPDSEASRKFYQHMQAKLFYAVTSNTPAQLIQARANAGQPNMGLQTWAGDRILQSDVTVGKNYLAEAETKELNRLTAIVLDIFEDQLDLGRLTLMSECTDLLDRQLAQLGRAVLKKPPPPRKEQADEHAKAEYKAFQANRRLSSKVAADSELAALRAASKQLPKAPRPGKPAKPK